MRDVTLGLNWYVNPYMRFMANYVNVLDVEGGAHDGDNPDVFQLRAQVAY
jgi:phosphate-selective porin OprO/OprP